MPGGNKSDAEDDLLKWMKAMGIERYHDAFIANGLDKQGLLELKSLLPTATPVIVNMLNLTKLGDVVQITSAIKSL